GEKERPQNRCRPGFFAGNPRRIRRGFSEHQRRIDSGSKALRASIQKKWDKGALIILTQKGQTYLCHFISALASSASPRLVYRGERHVLLYNNQLRLLPPHA
ncbi:MAG: hypothetical protein J6V45_05890, partial [Kiritimatiellae bacterium]|nr:hypothetical protein [Kiritimatiellia bacterium]